MATATAPNPTKSDEVVNLCKSLFDGQKALEKRLDDLSKPVHDAAKLFSQGGSAEKEEGKAGFKSLQHQLMVIRRQALGQASDEDRKMLHAVPKVFLDRAAKAGFDEAFVKATGMSEAIGPDGGFLLAPTFAEGVLEIAHQFEDLASRCDRYEMSTASLRIRAVDETSIATTRRGGVLGYWVDEGGTLTGSKPKFRYIEIVPHKVAVLTYLTDELMQDGPMTEQFCSRYAAEELSFQLNDAIINGSGAGKPLGILNSGCTISISKETGQAAATIMSENLVKMFARGHAGSRAKFVWLTNQDTIPQLLLLTLGIGTAGMATYMPPGGLSQTPYTTILGKPVLEIPWCPTLGTVGDVMLADLSQFILATRGNVLATNSVHVQFVTDETAFKWTWRVAGQPWWNSALTPFKGSNTQSPFVTLATRS